MASEDRAINSVSSDSLIEFGIFSLTGYFPTDRTVLEQLGFLQKIISADPISKSFPDKNTD